MSLSYDRYLKAGDLYEGYDEDGGNLGLEPGGRKRSSRCGDASSKVQGMCVMVESSEFIPRFGHGHTCHTSIILHSYELSWPILGFV